MNEFNFYVRPLKTLAVQIHLNHTGYQDVVLNCNAGWEVYHFRRLEGVANQLDTTLYLEAAPDWEAFISLSLEAPNQTS